MAYSRKHAGPPSTFGGESASSGPVAEPSTAALMGNDALAGGLMAGVGADGGEKSTAGAGDEMDEAAVLALFGSDSRQLEVVEHLTVVEQGSFMTADELPSVVAEQLVEGFQFDGWDVRSAEEAMAMIDPDGVTVKQITVDATGECFTHLEFYMGDTEVGYIYAEGASELTAVVSDQDILSVASLDLHRFAGQGEGTIPAAPEMDSADRALLGFLGR